MSFARSSRFGAVQGKKFIHGNRGQDAEVGPDNDLGTVTDWLIEEGSSVAAGDPLFTVETEKTVNDVEGPSDGVVVKIVVAAGSEVPVSDAVAILAAPGESLSDDEIAALVGVTATSA